MVTVSRVCQQCSPSYLDTKVFILESGPYSEIHQKLAVLWEKGVPLIRELSSFQESLKMVVKSFFSLPSPSLSLTSIGAVSEGVFGLREEIFNGRWKMLLPQFLVLGQHVRRTTHRPHLSRRE